MTAILGAALYLGGVAFWTNGLYLAARPAVRALRRRWQSAGSEEGR